MRPHDPQGPGPQDPMQLDPHDLVRFIHEQPDDRPLEMWDYFNSGRCGCLLVHYGQHLGLSFNWFNDGKRAYVTRLNEPVAAFTERPWSVFQNGEFPTYASNYADIKNHLKLQYQQ